MATETGFFVDFLLYPCCERMAPIRSLSMFVRAALPWKTCMLCVVRLVARKVFQFASSAGSLACALASA